MVAKKKSFKQAYKEAARKAAKIPGFPSKDKIFEKREANLFVAELRDVAMKVKDKCDCVERECYKILKDGSVKEPVRFPGQCPSTFTIGNLTIRCNWCQAGHGGQHHAMVLKGKTRADIAWFSH